MQPGKFTSHGLGAVGNRRQFLRISGTSVLTLGTVAGLASCRAPWQKTAVEAATAAGAALPDNWLAELAIAVGAAEVTNILNGGLQRAWHAWEPSVGATMRSIQADGLFIPGGVGWIHPIPPTVLVRASTKKGRNPKSDHLVAFVETGQAHIMFRPWAWQTLWMYIYYLTNGQTGANLDVAKAVCALTLLPSGTRPKTGKSPEGTVGWMTYKSRNGTVEITRVRGPEGSVSGVITASAIPGADGKPSTQSFTLPHG
jgi:hypothetical protein